MKKSILLFFCFVIWILNNSCHKLRDYFRDPACEALIETIHSVSLTSYAANLSMAVMNGETFTNTTVVRSNAGFPSTAIVTIIPDSESGFSFASEKADLITIAGIWTDQNTAVLSVLYTNYHVLTNTIDIVGIETIPVIREGQITHVAIANQDIQLNPDQDAFLSINLNTFEIESELLRLQVPAADDVYIAVSQQAYLVDVSTNGTLQTFTDDNYSITGGGQLIEIDGSDAEITQIAMIEVDITPDCILNPINGMALSRVVGLKNPVPDLGTVVLDFSNQCNGTASVYAATGMYAGANGKKIPFRL